MGDNETKPKEALPSWQVKLDTPNPQPTTEHIKSSASSEAKPRASVLEDARKFLNEDEVKDASTDRKVTFLESKGLTSDEISQLLGVTRNIEASNPESQTSTSSQTPVQQPVGSSSISTSSQASAPQLQPPPRAQQNAPPIITYPEFLTTPTSPPPLITASRLLKTLYLFGGLTTLLYGTTNYLIKPMAEALADSRHDLAASTQTNLDAFLKKLKPLVSEVPRPVAARTERHEDEDDHSSDGDPTEMFHRDIGVQTSPTVTRPESPSEDPKLSVTEAQAKQTSSIGAILSDIDLSISSELHEASNLQSGIDDLKKYLDTLMYSPPAFSYGSGSAYGSKRDEDDEIGRLKREIRAVKGVLLTARSFPGIGAGSR